MRQPSTLHCPPINTPADVAVAVEHADYVNAHTPITYPSLTSTGIFLGLSVTVLFPALLPNNLRACPSVAVSIAWKGILLAFKIVSMRDVAVMMWDEPAVREVNRNSRGSLSHSLRSIAEAIVTTIVQIGSKIVEYNAVRIKNWLLLCRFMWEPMTRGVP